MIINVNAKLITARVYDLKDKETNQPNGKKGITDVFILVDSNNDYALSGSVKKCSVNVENYKGPYDFSNFSRLQPVSVELDMSVFEGREVYRLLNLIKVESKK